MKQYNVPHCFEFQCCWKVILLRFTILNPVFFQSGAEIMKQLAELLASRCKCDLGTTFSQFFSTTRSNTEEWTTLQKYRFSRKFTWTNGNEPTISFLMKRYCMAIILRVAAKFTWDKSGYILGTKPGRKRSCNIVQCLINSVSTKKTEKLAAKI